MVQDARRAAAELAPHSPFRAPVVMLAGVGALLTGDDDAERALAEAQEAAAAEGATAAGLIAAAERALLALGRGDIGAVQERVDEGWTFLAPTLVGDYAHAAILIAAEARLAIARGGMQRARELATSAQRLRPQLSEALTWLSVQARLELARVHLALADPDGARVLLDEAGEITRRRPRMGTLLHQLDEMRSLLRSVSGPGAGWATTLTAAELRLLPLLTTHLSFAEIAERLYVSRNTVKTQAISIYRKLDVSSRSEAIERAGELGLVDPAVTARPAR
jgi:LuxR family maltose regulon positive regulatory protein